MNKSYYLTRVRVLLALLVIIAILAIGAGVIYHEEGSGSWASQPSGTEVLKEEGPGLRDEPVQVIKEEGPGLSNWWLGREVQIVKEEGPGLSRWWLGREVQIVKEEGPGLLIDV